MQGARKPSLFYLPASLFLRDERRSQLRMRWLLVVDRLVVGELQVEKCILEGVGARVFVVNPFRQPSGRLDCGNWLDMKFIEANTHSSNSLIVSLWRGIINSSKSIRATWEYLEIERRNRTSQLSPDKTFTLRSISYLTCTFADTNSRLTRQTVPRCGSPSATSSSSSKALFRQ